MDVAFLRTVPLFEGLSSVQLEKVAPLTTERRVAAGGLIFKEGHPGQEFFIIAEGQVRISKHVPNVGEEALAILDSGAYFGEMALFEDAPRSADAIAHTDCRLRVIRRDDLDGLLFTDKDIAYSLLWTFVRTLAARLRETNDKITAFFAMSARF